MYVLVTITCASYTQQASSMERWNGKVALVSGASVGIGFEIVNKLARAGMKVVGFSRNPEKLQVRTVG